MKSEFNQQMQGISPEQTRAALMPSIEKSMVEREQPAPALKPSLGLGQEVDNQTHKQKLIEERRRLQIFRDQAITIQAKIRMNGKVISTSIDKPMLPIYAAHKLVNDFNMYSAQEYDMKQMGISF